jgi:hypothetical protein
MKYGISILALFFVLSAVPASAFESRNPERSEPRLLLELEATPSPVQQDFDRYVDELAAAARRDAFYGAQARKQDEARKLEAKALNPIVLFRW